ncbi:hypothetical protein HMN09_00097200 [Mycena chlorophos]|uniref:DUF6534 domain-containing protein n=1 Tax=Mycena chlorophos TaxID=658473 RepID=A0A8H6TUQ1_MYCCL|nr:hypothetical protein HMN09_00097200 [Mycena chlorophos]
MADHVQITVGAMLAGCMVSVGLSAVLGFQTFLYFQIFPADSMRYKLLVGWIWIADAAHTALICTSIWQYAVNRFGNPVGTDSIVPSLAATVAITALTTVSVNLFYTWRIHRMSKGNRILTAALCILCLALSATEMVLTHTFAAFSAGFNTVLTCGLAVSASTDVVISVARYYYLRNLRQGYSDTQEVVDAVMMFTINDGLLTCAVVITVIILLLRGPGLIWLGVYFTIAKFFSNSVLATLNLRNFYRHRPRPMGIAMKRQTGANPFLSNTTAATKDSKRGPSGDQMEVFVDQQVEYNVAMADLLAGVDRRENVKGSADSSMLVM